MSEPARASGRVSTSDGQPIAGALVTLAPLDDDDRLPTTVRTDAGGGWSIAAIEPGRHALSATAAGFLPGIRAEITLRAGAVHDGLDLQLERGGNLLSGVVHDLTGGVVEGALIQVTAQAGLLHMRERDSYFTLSDADGRYALQVPDGRHRIRASHLDYSAEQVVLELAGADQRRDFSLVPAAVIEGVVLRESDRQPVAHAEITWTRERSVMLPGGDRMNRRERGGRLIADERGRFRVRGLPPGLVELSARASRFASETAVEVPVGIAERIEGVELWLIAAADVRGRVIDLHADGGGVEGAHVQLHGELGFGSSTSTDAEGRFVIRGVLPGRYGVRASAAGYRFMRESETLTIDGAEPPELELALERGAMIRGRVEPPLLAEVAIELRPEAMRIGQGGTFSLVGPVLSQSETGEFELGPVDPGQYTLEARAADGRGGTVDVEVGADGADGVIISLQPRAVLAGLVQDTNGKPVGDVSVRARKQSPAHGSVSVVVNGRELTAASSPTSIEGHFEIAGLAAGTWIVEVVDAQGDKLGTNGSISVALEHGRREELVIRIEPRDGTIRGTVRDAEGQPVADAWVSAAFLRAASGPEREPAGMRSEMTMIIADSDGASMPSLPPVLTDAEGRFRLTGLRRGDYLLTAELDGGTSKATLEPVRPDAEVTLELAPLGALEGRVLSDGQPADCTVRISGPSPRRVRVRDGSFEAKRLEPGHYTVEASAGQGSTRTTVTIEAGATANVELVLERFATITGKVIDEEGKPIAGAELLIGSGEGGRVEVSREDGDPQYRTEDDGSFEIHAAAGSRVLLVQGRDSPMPIAIEPFVAKSGETLDLGEIRPRKLDGMLRDGPE